MEYDYKEISVYFDSNLKLMGVPCGKSIKYDIAGLDLLLTLDFTECATELEDFLKKLFNLCYSKKCIDDGKTAIETYKNSKSYAAAVKNLNLVVVFWSKTEGFTVMPTSRSQQHKGAFHFIDEKKLVVPNEHEKGSLAQAFKQAMAIAQ